MAQKRGICDKCDQEYGTYEKAIERRLDGLSHWLVGLESRILELEGDTVVEEPESEIKFMYAEPEHEYDESHIPPGAAERYDVALQALDRRIDRVNKEQRSIRCQLRDFGSRVDNLAHGGACLSDALEILGDRIEELEKHHK